MGTFEEYVAEKVAARINRHTICVWCDAHAEWEPFIDSLEGSSGETGPVNVSIGGTDAMLVRYRGSFLEVKQLAETAMVKDEVPKLLVYLPGQEPNPELDVLMELKRAGQGAYKPYLRQLARECLRGLGCTDGRVDELIGGEDIGFQDVAAIVEQLSGVETGSLLRLVYGGTTDDKRIIARWLADGSHDGDIESKGAVTELASLLEVKLDLDLGDDELDLDKARERAWRHVLVGELKMDLQCAPPESLSRIGVVGSQSHDRLRKLMEILREFHSREYEQMADKVQAQLGLAGLDIDSSKLGSIDTFRFEERALLGHCGGLIEEGSFKQALELVEERKPSFWVRMSAERMGQWEACRLLAELGRLASGARDGLAGMRDASSKQWVDAYEESLWKVDQAHRQLEQHLAMMEGELEVEAALAKVRRAYSRLESDMAEGFLGALRSSDWSVEGALGQQEAFGKHVDGASGRTAYFLVDALRYEMGQELLASLSDVKESSIDAMVARLPSITPVGMAALMPDASSGMALEEGSGRLVVSVAGQDLPGSKERMRFLTTRRSSAQETTLDELLARSIKVLEERLAYCKLLVVRSQEIDQLGESGSDLAARQAMGSIVGSIRKAIRRLAGLGFQQMVVVADHGYLYAGHKGEDMRLDSPGGHEVELHRRCWIGKGGHTPKGALRVGAVDLGYSSDLDVIFPEGTAVFKARGGLSFHHGGPSLQEMVVPAISVRVSAPVEESKDGLQLSLSNAPDVITNRIFTVELELSGSDLFAQQEVISVTVTLESDGAVVGQAIMAADGSVDKATGQVEISAGGSIQLGLSLTDEDAEHVTIVVRDSETERDLCKSDPIPVRLGVR